jgi:hypothetical protein
MKIASKKNTGASSILGVIPLFLRAIFWGIGMMDCWNSGIMGIKIGNKGFFVFLLPTPSFQESIVPISQLRCSSWGKTPKLLYDQQVVGYSSKCEEIPEVVTDSSNFRFV